MPEPTVPDPTDTPATALGPTSLVFGAVAATGACAPVFAFVPLPWAVLAGGLAVTFGPWGIHHARRGTGRLWTAVVGTALGAIGLVGSVGFLWALSA